MMIMDCEFLDFFSSSSLFGWLWYLSSGNWSNVHFFSHLFSVTLLLLLLCVKHSGRMNGLNTQQTAMHYNHWNRKAMGKNQWQQQQQQISIIKRSIWWKFFFLFVHNSCVCLFVWRLSSCIVIMFSMDFAK